jgi:hypothetical protein
MALILTYWNANSPYWCLVRINGDEAKTFPDTAFASFHAMVRDDPDIYCLITELCNNTERVVAYNNGHLALNAIAWCRYSRR